MFYLIQGLSENLIFKEIGRIVCRVRTNEDKRHVSVIIFFVVSFYFQFLTVIYTSKLPNRKHKYILWKKTKCSEIM